MSGRGSSLASGTGEPVRTVRTSSRPACESPARTSRCCAAGARRAGRRRRARPARRAASGDPATSERDARAAVEADLAGEAVHVRAAEGSQRHGPSRVHSTSVSSRGIPRPRRPLLLLAVLTALAALGQLPAAAAAETGGAGEVEAAPVSATRRSTARACGSGTSTAPGRQHPGDRRPAPSAPASAPSTSRPATAASVWSQFTHRPGRRRCTAAGSTSAPGSSSTATARWPRRRSARPRSKRAPTAW